MPRPVAVGEAAVGAAGKNDERITGASMKKPTVAELQAKIEEMEKRISFLEGRLVQFIPYLPVQNDPPPEMPWRFIPQSNS